MPSVTPLAARLRALRDSAGLTQLKLSKALKVSVPLISSWEKTTTPPVRRIDELARIFAAVPEGRPALRPLNQFTEAERGVYNRLHAELLRLRQTDVAGPAPAVDSPLQFGLGEAVTIVCSQLPAGRRKTFGDDDPADANFIESYKYADLDALLELLPFVLRLNPVSPITVGTADELTTDDLTAHLIALGGVDWNRVTRALMPFFHDIPVAQVPRSADEDAGGFTVRTGESQPRRLVPRVRREGDRTTLVEDVAHFLRAPNPYNRQRTLTIFNGMFSRGSYGVVRALTDPKIQERNAAHAARRLNRQQTYSVICRVKIVANEVVVPDWTLADDRLHEWPEDVA
ncbi:helix-turn-helix domain-containing protein [Actinoplanes sp. NPDC049265]|uniref:helix-turn-helix domain-containing protein n=1 Tax=Actinoplanes sp. NPDC049265 TaxID=3363902 RepID=UPI003717833F